MDDNDLERLADRLAEKLEAQSQWCAAPRLMDIGAAAAYLGKSVEELQDMITRGIVPITKLDGKGQFDRKALDEVRSGLQSPVRLAFAAVRRGATAERFVYLIACGRETVKIGVTANLKSRMKALQTACPTPLRLLAAVAGDTETEQALHNIFSGYRVSGEWFRLEGDVLDFANGVKRL